MMRLTISLTVRALQGHARGSEIMERFPRKMDMTSIGLVIGSHIEASGYSGWMGTISNSSAHYLP